MYFTNTERGKAWSLDVTHENLLHICLMFCPLGERRLSRYYGWQAENCCYSKKTSVTFLTHPRSPTEIALSIQPAVQPPGILRNEHWSDMGVLLFSSVALRLGVYQSDGPTLCCQQRQPFDTSSLCFPTKQPPLPRETHLKSGNSNQKYVLFHNVFSPHACFSHALIPPSSHLAAELYFN